MKKIKYLLCLILLMNVFTVHIYAFEGFHQRTGTFYLAHEDEPNTLIQANQFNVVWESGIVKYFTKLDGGKVRIRKTESNGGYQEVQIIAIDEQELVLNIACEAHSYPMEFKEYKTGEMIQPGTYKVNKFTVGWFEIIKEDGTSTWIHPNRDENYDYVEGKNAYFKNGKSTLSVNQVNGVSLNTSYLLTSTNHSVRPAYASVPQYVTIHNTDSYSKGANALAHAKIQYERQNTNEVWASWHYQVDDHSIYQSIPLDEVAWHAGDGSMQGNTTIGIEICENSDGNYATAEKNAAYLAAQILYELGLPKDAIRMHKDWSGKTCPKNIINGTKGTMGWDEFKNTVSKYYDQLEEENKVIEIDPIFTTMAQEIGYISDRNILYKIPVNTTIEQLTNQILTYNDTAILTYTDSDDNIVTEGNLSTGYKMKVVMEEKQEESIEPEYPLDSEDTIEPDTSIDSENTHEEINSLSITEPIIKECTFILSILGDANSDGKVNAIDLLKIEKYILDPTNQKLNEIRMKSANVDFNDKITAVDLLKIEKFILNPSQFPLN